MRLLRSAALSSLRLFFFGALLVCVLAVCGMVLSYRLAMKLDPYPVA